MKQKSLLAIYATTILLLAPSAKAINVLDDIICDKTTGETAKQREERRWVRDAKGANISYSLNLPSIHLGNFGINFGAKIESDLGQGGKYVGADLWKLNTDIPGLAAGTEVAFVRQYPNRDESLCRWPINVIEMVPQKAADFKKKDGLKVGDLIVFKSHLTLGIPGMDAGLTSMKSPLAVSGIFEVQIFKMTENLVRVRVSGTDEVNGNLGIKLGFWDAADALTPTFEIKAIESKRAELLVWDYVFNLSEKLENGSQLSAAQIYDNFIGSQIQIELSKLTATHFSHAKENLKVVARGNINKSEKIKRVKSIEGIVKEDLSKPEEERRVIEVSRGGLKSSSLTSGFRFNFLRLFRIISEQSEYQSLLWYADESNVQSKFVLHGTSKENTYKALKIRGASLKSETALILNTTPEADFNQFTQANKQIDFMASGPNGSSKEDFEALNRNNVERFKNIELTGIYGIKASRSAEFKSINAGNTGEVFAIMNALSNAEDGKGNVDSILGQMQWQSEKDGSVKAPNWDEFKSSSHTNLRIRQDFMFKKELFEQQNLLPTTDIEVGKSLVYQKVIETLASLSKRGYVVNSTPLDSDERSNTHNLNCGKLVNFHAGPAWMGTSGADSVDQNICFRNQGNYVRAFQQDAVKIGDYLAPILVEKNDNTFRYAAYRKLIRLPLFMEIGGLIMMNIAESAVTSNGKNANLLKKFFVMRLTVDSQGKASHVGYFPDATQYSRIDRLNQILSYQSYLADHSYNLSNYINPDGQLKTLKEILAALDLAATPAPLIPRQ